MIIIINLSLIFFYKFKDRCLIIYNDSGNLTSIIGLIFLIVDNKLTKQVNNIRLFVHNFSLFNNSEMV